MKRPLGVIGMTYLTSLAVVFHFYSFALVLILSVCAAAASVISLIVWRIVRRTRFQWTVIAVSLTVLASILAIFLYRNFAVAPVINAYADRELTVEGYVDDGVRFKNRSATFILQTEKIDGEDAHVAISFTTFSGYDLEPFDNIRVTVKPQRSKYSQSMSRRVFLYAYEDRDHPAEKTGGKHATLYRAAVFVRQFMRHIFSQSLDREAAGVVRAVLLGEKQALPEAYRKAFSETGTSYLIVVSGLHLAVFTLLFRKLFRKSEGIPCFLQLPVMFLLTFRFAALTGFSPSVMRAGIMLMISFLANLVLRDNDGFNSLGITALIMTVPNPYAVGDIGLLLSFSATFGILLWADKICIFLLGAFHIMPSLPQRKEKTRRAKCGNLLRRAARLLLSFLSTSLAATLWVIPLTVVFFGTITPLAVIISIVAYPLTCAVLLLGLLLVIAEGLWLTPIAAGLAMLLNLLSRALVGVVLWFARSPAADIPAEESFYLIWLVLTAALVAAGYLTHAGQRYVFSAILFSALVLTVGASVCCLCADDGAYLTVIRCGSGYTAAVGKGRNLSFLSCGGTQQAESEITELLRRADEVDTILLTGTDKRNTARLYAVMAESDVDTFVVSDKAEALLTVSQAAVVPYGDNTRLTVALNREVSVEVYCVGGLSYQYIRSPRYTVLLIPEKGEAEVLPQALRRADIVLLEGRASHLELLDCGKLYALSEKADDRAAVIADGTVCQFDLSE